MGGRWAVLALVLSSCAETRHLLEPADPAVSEAAGKCRKATADLYDCLWIYKSGEVEARKQCVSDSLARCAAQGIDVGCCQQDVTEPSLSP